MDVVGSDYLYLSDECWQDVFSLWSDAWSVGDPVNTRYMNCDEDLDDLFPAALVQSSDDNGDWMSDTMESVCPNSIAGYVSPPQIVMSSSGNSGECLSLTVCADGEGCNDVLSPTDSTSTVSSVGATLYSSGSPQVDDSEGFAELRSRPDSTGNDDIYFVADLRAECCDIPANSTSQETDKANMKSSNFVHEPRPQRVAARRAEIAFVRGNSDCDDDDDDGDDCDVVDEVQDSCIQSRHKLQDAEVAASRRGRSRAAEVNRNALNARINRQKKKAYMASLETQKTRLLSENKRMKTALTSLLCERDDLVDEVKYLKSVLANDSALAKLVESIHGPPLKLSSRFDRATVKRKGVEDDHDYDPRAKQRTSEHDMSVAGICVHVSENHLSVELCHRCAHMAGGGCSDKKSD